MKYWMAANINQSGRGENVNRTKSERYSETAEEGRLGRCNVWRGNQSIHVSGFMKITRTNCELNVALLWGHFKLDPLILLWLYFDFIGKYHSIFLFIYIVKFLLEILGWYFEHYQYSRATPPKCANWMNSLVGEYLTRLDRSPRIFWPCYWTARHTGGRNIAQVLQLSCY